MGCIGYLCLTIKDGISFIHRANGLKMDLQIRNAVASRQILNVYHFTKASNLDGILKSGLIPRASLDQIDGYDGFNDEHRLDNCREANCLSISHPNYKMFYALRCSNTQDKWVVIRIAPDILWEYNCAFCHDNAASNSITSEPLENRFGIVAFERMFSPYTFKPSREELNIPDSCPTNPQAEVLLFDTIPIKYFNSICCGDINTYNHYSALYPEINIIIDNSCFSARFDYANW